MKMILNLFFNNIIFKSISIYINIMEIIQDKISPKEDESKTYKIMAEYKKATYQCEQWNNTLSNGKDVRYEITTFFRWGTFFVDLNEKEKEELLKKDDIIINDVPGACCDEMWDSCDRYEEIVNKDKYTEEELKEIHKLLFFNDEDPEYYEPDSDDYADIDLLEANHWSMDDTIYGFTCPCVLEETTQE